MRSERIGDDPRLVPERVHRVAVALPVRAPPHLPLPPRQVARELREADRTVAVARGERVQRLTVREDRLEVVAARGRVRAGTDLVEDGLQVRAAADGWRWGRCGRGGAGV